MTDSTKTLIGTIAGLTALVAIFAIMSDCSKAVSRVNSAAIENCIRAGGKWWNTDAATNGGSCVTPK